MPSDTAIRRVDLAKIGVLRSDKEAWYRFAERDDGVLVGMFRHGTAAFALTFGMGPPLVRWVRRI